MGVYRPVHYEVHYHVSARFYHLQDIMVLAFVELVEFRVTNPNMTLLTAPTPLVAIRMCSTLSDLVSPPLTVSLDRG